MTDEVAPGVRRRPSVAVAQLDHALRSVKRFAAARVKATADDLRGRALYDLAQGLASVAAGERVEGAIAIKRAMREAEASRKVDALLPGVDAVRRWGREPAKRRRPARKSLRGVVRERGERLRREVEAMFREMGGAAT